MTINRWDIMEILFEMDSLIIKNPSEKVDVGVFADRILAALEKEREGEKVLSIGVFYSVNINLMDGRSVYKAIASNQQGQLIFRPTKAEKGGGL